MKAYKYILAIATVLVFLPSCENWFNIPPKNQIEAEKLFKTEKGFCDAVTGAYSLMARPEAYGGNETVFFFDLAARVWSYAKTDIKSVQQHDYSNSAVKSFIESMWASNYNCIANCNSILENVDAKQHIFNDGMYELVKAEAMAIRAYNLFDMLRAFGPIPLSKNVNTPAIPITTHLAPNPVKLSSTKDVVEFIFKDLTEARRMIAGIDPIYPGNVQPNEAALPFWDLRLNRRSKMNYYAITALMARTALWMAGADSKYKPMAYEYATEVISSGRFPLYDPNSSASQKTDFYEWVDTRERIFSAYSRGLDDYTVKYFFYSSATLFVSMDNDQIDDIYDGIFISAFDPRASFTNGGENTNYGSYPNKFKGRTNMPLLKIAEMYYIAAETAPTREEAVEYLRAVRISRSIENRKPLAPDADLNREIMKEYRKEFVAEGQMFYYYKRRDVSRLPMDNKLAGPKVYVLPLPDNEIEFGGK